MKRIGLTTIGRRSGQARTVSLYAFPDGDRLLIVGSRGGSAHDPAWVRNLRDEPRATLRSGRDERQVRAREADGPERERLWLIVSRAFPLYATFQRRTNRRIPIFVLEPVSDP
jgi:F420H(2)-dependent quinone reductase